MPVKTPSFLRPQIAAFRKAAIKEKRNRITRMSVGANAPAPIFSMIANDIFVGVNPERVQTVFFFNDASAAVNKILTKAKSRSVVRTNQNERIDFFIQTIQKLRANNVRLLKLKTSNGISYYATRDPMTFVLSSHFITDKQPDWKKIDAFVIKQNDAYHSGAAQSKLSDKEFDDWKEIYEIYERKWPMQNKVGAPVRSKDKVTLPQQMGSLEKEKTPQEIKTWVRKQNIKGELVYTPKIDGVSGLIVYKNGKLQNAYSRGNGIKGRDITRHVLLIKDIPKTIKYKEPLHVRGEFVIPREDFLRMFSQTYANPRNMVAGIMNRSDSDAHELESVKFFAFSGDLDMKSKSLELKQLKTLGFNVVPYVKYTHSSNFDSLDEHLINFDKKLGVEMDGGVLEASDPKERRRIGLETNSINPKFARAYKPPRLDNLAQTEVLDVEWSVTRHRVLKPVAILKPIKLAGVTVSRATLFNAAFVENNRIGKGAVVELTRSGEVIPYVLRVVKPAKNGSIGVPDRQKFGAYHFNDTRVDYVLGEGVFSEDAKIQNILHFFEKCGVERIKEETIRNFYAHGFKNIDEIVRMDYDDLINMDRISEKSANNILEEFKKLQAVPMHMLMYASNMFGQNFGSRRFKALIDKFGLQTLKWKGKTVREIAEAVSQVDGFSYASGKQFAKGLQPFLRFKKSLEPYVNGVYPQKERRVSNKLNGKTIVFTGFRDAAMESIISKNGGNIGGTVSKKTDIVLWTGSKSIKASKAESLGIPLMTLDQFRKKFGL